MSFFKREFYIYQYVQNSCRWNNQFCFQQNVPHRPRATSSSQGSSGTDTETRTLLTNSDKSKVASAQVTFWLKFRPTREKYQRLITVLHWINFVCVLNLSKSFSECVIVDGSVERRDTKTTKQSGQHQKRRTSKFNDVTRRQSPPFCRRRLLRRNRHQRWRLKNDSLRRVKKLLAT
jgi:hypothetical protein